MKNVECALLSDGILFMKNENVFSSCVHELTAHVIRKKATYPFREQLQSIVFHLKEACDTLVIMA